MLETNQMPRFESYGNYSSDNYGIHTLVFTDSEGRDFYYSYRTLVAVRAPGYGLVVCQNIWSNTTGKHLNWIDYGDKKSRLDPREFGRVVEEILKD